tara:strand:- start:4288 stop:5169 length:882 start_codon:yes stop_codon:yes gene_type:complete
MNPFLIKNKSSNLPDYCYLIAEIGINHNGSLIIAKDLIAQSKAAGFDAVKFQKRTIDIVYSEETLSSYRVSPWGETTREQKEGLELSLEEYEEIDKYCKMLDIDWFVSCWDIQSQKDMQHFNTPYNKIASAMGTNWDFVEIVASEKKPTFASTGMMDIEQIDKLVEIFNINKCPLILMHTVSTYPASEKDLNLNCIKTLSDRYNLPVGYSGHETSTAPSIFAAVLGAPVIERHVTLDRAMYGSDQSASLELPGMYSLCSTIRKLNDCLGDGEKRILKEEELVSQKLRYWRQEK